MAKTNKHELHFKVGLTKSVHIGTIKLPKKKRGGISGKPHIIGRRNLTLKEIRECNCDTGRFCPTHQGGCEKHDSLCADGHCTCDTVSKEEAIKMKKKAVR